MMSQRTVLPPVRQLVMRYLVRRALAPSALQSQLHTTAWGRGTAVIQSHRELQRRRAASVRLPRSDSSNLLRSASVQSQQSPAK